MNDRMRRDLTEEAYGGRQHEQAQEDHGQHVVAVERSMFLACHAAILTRVSAAVCNNKRRA
jgi:hypothetical protein